VLRHMWGRNYQTVYKACFSFSILRDGYLERALLPYLLSSSSAQFPRPLTFGSIDVFLYLFSPTTLFRGIRVLKVTNFLFDAFDAK